MPINVTLLFSREQYLAAAEAYLRGIERRIAAGLEPDGRARSPRCSSAAGTWRSQDKVPARAAQPARHRRSRQRTYKAYRELLASPRWQRLADAGARPQRLLWASTGTKDPNASDTLYVEALAAPYTVNTMPEKTLLAFADHGELGAPMRGRRRRCRGGARRVRAGRHRRRRARRRSCSSEGAEAFVKSWNELLDAHRRQERRS